MAARKSLGTILYAGPSMLDGAPIVAIALAGKSSNSKTGALVQTYILRSDIDPVAAIKVGSDVSICGGCKHRGASGDGKGRTCYVNVGQGALGVYRAFKRGRYEVGEVFDVMAAGRNRKVRLGTYGDPAAVPAAIWQVLLSQAIGHTGYTHQWSSNANAQALKGIVMASADSVTEAQAAHSAGWATFRVRLPSESGSRIPGEMQCPAAKEVGAPVTCAQCMQCDGAGRSMAINAHGGTAVMGNVRRIDAINV